jgi:hypothetical protein
MAGRSRHLQLWQEIALTLTLKVVLLAVIWFAWFSAPEDRTLDDQKIASQIFSSQIQKGPDHDAVSRTR